MWRLGCAMWRELGSSPTGRIVWERMSAREEEQTEVLSVEHAMLRTIVWTMAMEQNRSICATFLI